MQFQVPQFIEVEDKILGPFTFKQAIYVVGGLGISYVLWQVLPLPAAAPLMLMIAGSGAALAFLKFNDRPFILALEHGFFYVISNKLYLWDAQREQKKKEVRTDTQKLDASAIPKLSNSKLHELAWSLDIRERISSADSSLDLGAEEPEAFRESGDNGVTNAFRTAQDARIV